MAELRYPIGIQTFSELIEKGYSYIDKTQYILPLTKQGKYIFLSRPRRFGKSLLLSTLEAYFSGRRDLFRGLAADSMELDWTANPVLHFDFNAEDFSREDGLELLIDEYLRNFEDTYGRRCEDVTPSQRFRHLIKSVYETTGRQVVILVDEYDKPLLSIEENIPLFEKNQNLLKSFFGNLKTMDSYIRFAFITGVARFTKVSIFSDLNNLMDISMVNAYADICGWTEEELCDMFKAGIKALADERGEDLETTLSALRDFYDGYLFAAKGSRLYNPFSVLCALDTKEIEPYWFETGTPTFLAKRFKANGFYPPEIEGQLYSKSELMAVEIADSNPIPLMFQTGYLTIASYKSDINLYELRFPNREVEISFYERLLPIYAPATDNPASPFKFSNFKLDLYQGRPTDFMNRLSTLFKELPGEDHNESVYRAITFLLATLCGTRVTAEHHSYKGRSDIEVYTTQYIYIFEFKYNKSVSEAMDQIRTRDYAGRLALDYRTVYLIGANYCEKKGERGLHFVIERMHPRS